MGFASKLDFCGLADGTSIVVKSHTRPGSSTVATCANDEGDVVDVTKTEVVCDPSNEYAIKGDIADLKVTLGKVTEVDLGTASAPDVRHFVLKSVSLGTSNSGTPTLSAQAEQVPSSTASRTYTVDLGAVRSRCKAQILASMFSVAGEGTHLQKADYTLSVEVSHTTVDGARVTYDVYGGKVEASVEAKRAGAVAPTITASAEGVVAVTGDPSESRPDSDYASVSATVTRYLKADAA